MKCRYLDLGIHVPRTSQANVFLSAGVQFCKPSIQTWHVIGAKIRFGRQCQPSKKKNMRYHCQFLDSITKVVTKLLLLSLLRRISCSLIIAVVPNHCNI
uniref:Uncharacterized protein n=1 Tax=Arundo donax TaxID=35708 RepID=A0A0A9H355_ARUDO